MESEHKPSLSHDWPMVSYMVPLFHGKVPVAKVYGPTPESSEDRANLFASARDMLTALEGFLAAVDGIDERGFSNAHLMMIGQAKSAARAAIAKAKGE